MSSSTDSTLPPRQAINAASRLHDLLTRLKRAQGKNACSVFPELLPGKKLPGEQGSFRNDQNYVILQSISLFGDMIEDFERDIRLSGANEEEQKFYSSCITGILQALSPELYNSPWNSIREGISAVDLARLEGADMFLRRFIDERGLYPADFAPISSSIEQAISAVENSDLPTTVKDLILSRLTDINVSIARYRFRGVEGIKEAIATYAGSVSMAASALESNLSPPAKTSLRDVLSTASSLFTIAHGVTWVWPALKTGTDIAIALLQ